MKHVNKVKFGVGDRIEVLSMLFTSGDMVIQNGRDFTGCTGVVEMIETISERDARLESLEYPGTDCSIRYIVMMDFEVNPKQRTWYFHGHVLRHEHQLFRRDEWEQGTRVM